MRLGFPKVWYCSQAPFMSVAVIAFMVFQIVEAEGFASAGFVLMIVWTVLCWMFLVLGLPVITYAFRREQRRDLIELGNLIQERLSAAAWDDFDEVDSYP